MSIRLDERRYVEELKRLVADFRMWKNPLVPLPDGFEDDLAWRSYRVFGQTSPADIIALAVRTRDEDLVAQGEGFISDSVSMIDDEDVFGWLFRMIWGKELQLRQQIADADVENLDATFDFLTSACRLAAHILLGWGEGDASSAYIARLFLIEQYDEALNCILPYSNVSLNANETELVVSDLRDRAIAAAMRRGETAAMETKLHKAEDGPHYSSGEDSTASDDGEGLDVADDGRPFPQSDVLYLFDADHVIEAYRYFLDHADGDADGDGELDDGNPWRRPDFVQDKLLTLAGAGIVEPLVSTALEQGDGDRLEAALNLLTIYRGIVCDDGILALPIIAARTLQDSDGLRPDADLDQRMRYLESSRDLCSSMAAMLLARIPDPSWSRRLAMDLLNADMESYVRHVRELAES